MAPAAVSLHERSELNSQSRISVVVEAWTEGFNVGAIVILMLIVLCNFRKGVLLHKLIIIEVSLCENID